MFRVFKITDGGSQPKSNELVGLLIVQTDEGFFVVAPDAPNEPPRVLAQSGLIDFNGKPPLFKFGFDNFKKSNWILNCNQASPSLQNPDTLEGKWVSLPSPASVASSDYSKAIPDEEDNWVATGGGRGAEGDEEARPASAY